jgi:Big-like domain-containing protein/calcineurin-like phosphoesterase family protein
MRRFVLFCLFVTAVIAPVGVRAATQLTFPPSADVYVTGDKPTTNFGSAANVEADSSPAERSLFRFEVSGVGAGQVTSAKLRLFNTNDSSVGGDFFRLATAPAWTEGGVNWNTAPATVGTPVASIGTVALNKWYEVELEALITGDGVFEFGMSSTSSNGVGYASKEATAANRPQLIVTFDPPPADPTIPTVAITAPTAGSVVAGIASIRASATDDVGVLSVEFFVDGASVGSDVEAPFAYDWNTTTVPDGAHGISAKAYDADAKTGSSTAVSVTVKNGKDPEQRTLAPSADVYVTGDKPTTNFGSTANVQADTSPAERSLFRFEVSGVGAGQVTGAKLRLFNTNDSSVGGNFFRLATAPAWTEGGVNWTTAPATVGTPVASIGTVAQDKWYEVELKSIITGDGVFEFGLSSTSSNGVWYASKEATAANRPQLILTYNPVPVDPTVPKAAITFPTAGSVVAGTVSVEASATDDVGVLTVEFFVDGALAGTDVGAPFGFDWDSTAVADGGHDLVAKASDADGKSGTSPVVRVTVRNTVDTTPPAAPGNLRATAVGSSRIDLTWNPATDDTGVTQYDVFRDGAQITWTTSPTYGDTGVSGGRTYSYVVKARDAAGNVSASSNTATATTPTPSATFSFGVAGDMGANSKTAYSLDKLDSSGVSFFMAIGDLDYGEVSSPSAWCSYVKSHLPTLGSNFPFELVAGNHEDSKIQEHAACLPDRLNSKIGPGSIYGGEYYFDYPASNPLVRVLMISPKLSILGKSYNYSKGDVHYNFVSNALDDARDKGIPWTVVGFHMTSPGTDLMNLMIGKKVDIFVYGHSHGYSRGKQLMPCPTGSTFDCVSDDGSDGVYPRDGGSVDLRNGSFGQGSPTGFTKITVSADRLDAQFVGKTTDVWSIR